MHTARVAEVPKLSEKRKPVVEKGERNRSKGILEAQKVPEGAAFQATLHVHAQFLPIWGSLNGTLFLLI